MSPAEASEAAELAEAEIRYRNQVGRLMYEAGRREAEADGRSVVPHHRSDPRSGSCRDRGAPLGDQQAVSTSLTRARATSPAAPARRNPSPNWRPDD